MHNNGDFQSRTELELRRAAAPRARKRFFVQKIAGRLDLTNSDLNGLSLTTYNNQKIWFTCIQVAKLNMIDEAKLFAFLVIFM